MAPFAPDAARDLLTAVTRPVSHAEAAQHLAREAASLDAFAALALCNVAQLSGQQLANLVRPACVWVGGEGCCAALMFMHASLGPV